MDREPFESEQRPREAGAGRAGRSADGWLRPRVEVISLSCEITSYAPDDEPLF